MGRRSWDFCSARIRGVASIGAFGAEPRMNFQSLGPFISYFVSYSSLIKAQWPCFQAFNCLMSRKDLYQNAYSQNANIHGSCTQCEAVWGLNVTVAERRAYNDFWLAENVSTSSFVSLMLYMPWLQKCSATSSLKSLSFTIILTGGVPAGFHWASSNHKPEFWFLFKAFTVLLTPLKMIRVAL